MTETRNLIPSRFQTRRRRPPRRRQVKPPRMTRFEDRLAARIIGLVDKVGDEIKETLFPNLDSIIAEAAQDAAVMVIEPTIREDDTDLTVDKMRSDSDIVAPWRGTQAIRQDDAARRIGRVFSDLTVFAEQFLPDSMIANLAERFAFDVNDVNKSFNEQNVRTLLGVDPLNPEPWLIPEIDAFTQENVGLIKGVTTEQIADLQQTVQRLVRQGASSAQIRNEIDQIMQDTRARAKLIGRDQTSKFNGRLSQLRQRQIGVEEYTWRTSDDERVRSTHAALDDTVHKWSEGGGLGPVTVTSGKRAGERNHPGQDIQCRCIAEPVLRDDRGRVIA